MFGKNLYIWKTEARLTEEELGEKLKISRQIISNYENSHNQPSLEIFFEI